MPMPTRGRLLLAAVLLASPLSAQSARPETQGFDASLTCAEASALVSERASRGFVDAAVLRVGSRSQGDEAMRRLTDLAFSRGDCPAAFAVRGLVKHEVADSGWAPKDAPGQRPGIPFREDAIYDLALAADAPGPVASAAAIVGVELLLPEQPQLPWLVREVGPGLVKALASPSSVADTLRFLQRGRLAAWLWMPDVADSSFVAYRDAGGSADRAALELARVRLATGGTDGHALYAQAAASGDSAVAAGLRTDLALFADSAEMAAFDAQPAAGRAEWLRAFWEDRDLESLRPRGSRLVEHYRRIGEARLRYRLLVYPRRYELDELWQNPDAEYDDRGLIFIRHGFPDDTAAATRPGACPNVSWLYRRPDGNMIFHFVARENPNDWRLVETLANVGGTSGVTTRVRRAGPTHSCAPVDGLLESRAQLDPIYQRLAVSGSRLDWEREVEYMERSREVGTTTDSDPLRFPRVLDLAWRAYGLLGESPGTGRILLVLSVPAEGLQPISTSPLGYGFRLGIVARSGQHLIEVDTVRRFAVPQAPAPGQMLTFTSEHPAAPGRWTVGAAIRQPVDSAGQFFHDRDVSVPDPSGAALAMSDILLGDGTGGRPWMAPDGAFPLSATGSFVRGEPILVYYELTGTTAGQRVTTDVEFTREGSDDPTTLRFTEDGRGGIERFRRELDTRRLREGRYTLRFRVASEGGTPVVRETGIFIRDD